VQAGHTRMRLGRTVAIGIATLGSGDAHGDEPPSTEPERDHRQVLPGGLVLEGVAAPSLEPTAAMGAALELNRRFGAFRALLRFRGVSDPGAPDEPGATFGAAGLGVAYDTRDTPLLPRRGSHLEAVIERGANRFERRALVAEHARSIGPLTLRIHVHADSMRTGDPEGVAAVALPGLGVRGHGFAPRAPLVSQVEAMTRVELEAPIARRLAFAAWYDAGWRRTGDRDGTTTEGVRHAAGAGLIWRLPSGALRIDVAQPLASHRGAEVTLGVSWSF
jgi:hypothetical protein